MNGRSVLRTDRRLMAAGLLLCMLILIFYAVSGKAMGLVYEEADYTASAWGIEEIRIKARNMPVKVTSSSADDITIHYYTCERDPYEVSLDGSVLTLRYLNENLFEGTDSNPHVEVIVPSKYAGILQLETSNAPVSVSGLTSASHVSINTSNSSIEIDYVSAGQVIANTSNGAITLDEVTVAGTVDVMSSNGTLTARQVTARDKMRMETSNGRISVDQAASAVIELSSSNSSISGSVAGKRSDYSVSSGTSNGENSLVDGGKGNLKMTVYTSNGNINIRFLGE